MTARASLLKLFFRGRDMDANGDCSRYRFGPFCIDLEQGLLTRDGQTIPLEPKALKILTLLASHSGEVVSKEEIRAYVWPEIHVDPKNLGVQIVAVRKALEDSCSESAYIQTVPRRGYRFIAPVRKESASVEVRGSQIAMETPPQEVRVRRLPFQRMLMIGVACALMITFLKVGTWPWLQRIPAEPAHSVSVRASDPDAARLFERGQYFLETGGANVLTAINYLKEATRKDPHFAAAYAALAKAYVCWADYIDQTKEPLSLAEKAASQALELDRNASDAWLALAVTRSELHFQWALAETAYQRAIESDPLNATAHEWYGSYLSLTGKSMRAISELSKATALRPDSFVINRMAGEVRYYAGDYRGAQSAFRRALEIRPQSENVRDWLIRTYVTQQRKNPIAKPNLIEMFPPGGPPGLRDLQRAYEVGGSQGIRRARLEALLIENEAQHVDPMTLAAAYAAVGETAKALDTVEEALKQRTSTLRYLAVEPILDSLRKEPRFRKIMTSVGLPDFRSELLE